MAKVISPEQMKIIVIGGNHGWGRGDTVKEARKNARQPRQYIVFVVHPDTGVSEIDGSLSYPIAYPPKEIDRVGIPAKKTAKR